MGWGCFVYVHIPEKSVWRLSKEQGMGVVFWAIWANKTNLGNLY